MTIEEAERAVYTPAASPWRSSAASGTPARRLPRLAWDSVCLVARAGPLGFAVGALLTVIGSVAAAGLVFATRKLIHDFVGISAGSRTVLDAAPAILLIGAASAAATLSSSIQAQQQRLLGDQVASSVWRRLTYATCRVPLRDFEDPAFHDRLQRIVSSALSRPIAITNALVGLLGGVLGTVAVGGALLLVEPILIPVLAAVGIPALVAARFTSRSEFAFSQTNNQALYRRMYLRSLLVARLPAKEIRAFGAAPALRRAHDETDRAYLRQLRAQVMRRQAYSVGVILCSVAITCWSIFLVALMIEAGQLTIAEAGAAIIGARLLSSRLSQVFGAVSNMVEARPFLVDLQRFLDQAETSAPDVEPDVAPAPHADRVRVEGVSYAYPGSGEPALDGVSVEIRAGEVVALVGENGSGKTTLAKVVAGLYRPMAGRVLWDDRDAAALPEGAVRRATSVIFQDFVHYQMTVTENIGLGEPDSLDDEDAARAAARAAGAHEFLDRLPRGYDTLLTNEFLGGTELSLGQWQRVALARAMRRQASLVVLDEPTAALDPRAEAALFADVRRLLGGRSALFISHRFASVRSADRIYVLHHGRVVESGTHDELMARGGHYAELFELQARAYR